MLGGLRTPSLRSIFFPPLEIPCIQCMLLKNVLLCARYGTAFGVTYGITSDSPRDSPEQRLATPHRGLEITVRDSTTKASHVRLNDGCCVCAPHAHNQLLCQPHPAPRLTHNGTTAKGQKALPLPVLPSERLYHDSGETLHGQLQLFRAVIRDLTEKHFGFAHLHQTTAGISDPMHVEATH